MDIPFELLHFCIPTFLHFMPLLTFAFKTIRSGPILQPFTFFSEFRLLEDGSSPLVSLHTATSTYTSLQEQWA